MKSNYLRPAWIEVDLAAIKHNLKAIRRSVGQTAIMAVVKADGYGHGAVEVSKVAVENGVERLGVALLDELIVLREAEIDAPIHLLSDISDDAVEGCVYYDGIPMVNSLQIASRLNDEALKQKKRLKIHVKIDTGMSRVGVMPREAVEFVKNLTKFDSLEVEGLLTHFATADKPDSAYTARQAKKFNEVCSMLQSEGLRPPVIHAANSATTILLPQYRHDMVRIGIMTYGLHPCEATKDKIDLKPALGLKARVSRAATIKKKTGVSYGATYVASADTDIATLPLGYGDGYTRLLSNKSDCIINGELFRNIGNITMDQMMVEISNGAKVKAGDIATLIGAENSYSISVDDIARTLGTINYEVTCMLTKRLPKIYTNIS